MGYHVLFQGLLPAQGSNPRLLHLLHCMWILYQWAKPKKSYGNIIYCTSFIVFHYFFKMLLLLLSVFQLLDQHRERIYLEFHRTHISSHLGRFVVSVCLRCHVYIEIMCVWYVVFSLIWRSKEVVFFIAVWLIYNDMLVLGVR